MLKEMQRRRPGRSTKQKAVTYVLSFAKNFSGIGIYGLAFSLAIIYKTLLRFEVEPLLKRRENNYKWCDRSNPRDQVPRLKF